MNPCWLPAFLQRCLKIRIQSREHLGFRPGIEMGLGDGIGWHTFRHTYCSLLEDEVWEIIQPERV
jgi:hypothetical protein